MMTVAIPDKVEADPFDGYFSTRVIWKGGKKGWVCVCCGGETKTLYLCDSDPRYDDNVEMCNCDGAKEIGFDKLDCKKIFKGPEVSPSYTKDGSPQYVSR